MDNPGVKVIQPRHAYRGGFALSTRIAPTGVPERKIEIHFSPRLPDVPRVFIDGPQESPHRYSDSSLCMWYPYDPKEARWKPSNGPAALLGHIAVHLIKEQWYRQTGDWPGDEVGHLATCPTDHEQRTCSSC